MEMDKILNALRRLEANHINLVCQLAAENKALAASMLNIGIDFMSGLSKLDGDELNSKLMSIFELNRRSILTLEQPMEMPKNAQSIHESNGNPIIARIKSNERKIIVTMRELIQLDTDIGVAICRLDYKTAIELANTPADLVEENVYACKNKGLLKLMIKDLRSLKQFIEVKRLSQAGLHFDRLVG